jgi:hypothetical protein
MSSLHSHKVEWYDSFHNKWECELEAEAAWHRDKQQRDAIERHERAERVEEIRRASGAISHDPVTGDPDPGDRAYIWVLSKHRCATRCSQW